MDVIFTSARLRFVEFTMADAPLIYELNSDPDVVRYLHEPLTTLEVANDVLMNTILPQYAKYQHGRWAMYLKDTGEFIGWCGLKYRPEMKMVDLGYRLMKKYWGQGYATEAARRCIEYGFQVLAMKKIFAAAHVDNTASQKVLEKVGMQFIGRQIIDNCLTKTYEIVNDSN